MDLGYGPTELTDGSDVNVKEIETPRIILMILGLSD